MTQLLRLRRHRGGQAGAVLALVVVMFALLGPLLSDYHPDVPDYARQLAPPGGAHWLGTDESGRDQLARTIAGTRTSLQAVAVVVTLTTAIGLLAGGAAGYLGGVADAVIGRLIDVMLGLPSPIVALAVVGALGVGSGNLTLAVVAAGWAYPARIARATVLGSHQRLDVVAARMAGIRPARIVVTHVLPATFATVMIAAATGVGDVVLVLAGLSFLGLGAQPPTAELGQMLADSQAALGSSPWLLIGPATVIAVMVAAALLLSDALRDTADPAAPGRSRSVRVAPVGTGVAVPAEASLVVRGLTVTYPDGTRAVRAVDLTVGSGECLAVVGESGCGKSSLARAVLGLLPAGTHLTGDLAATATSPTGSLATAGASLTVLSERAWRRVRGRTIGYVAQDPYTACDPLHRVGHHVTEAWRVHGQRPRPGEVVDRVARLGVPGAASRLGERPNQWSGGMLQRATIAAATAHHPVVTVADEPTSALDAGLADDVLATLRRTSRSLLLISHDLRLVARHSDRTAVMYAGRIVEIGPTGDVLERPRHPYTRALLAATAQPGGPPPRALPGNPPPLTAAVTGCPLAARCPDAIAVCHDREPVLIAGVACWLGQPA